MIKQTAGSHRVYSLPGQILLSLVAALAASVILAAEPRLVPFQARLTDGAGTDLTGDYRITFAIYDEPTGGTADWTELHESVSVVNSNRGQTLRYPLKICR